MDEDTVAGIIADKYARIILKGTFRAGKSARELSEEYNIPIVACYRTLKKMEEAGLLDKKKRKKGKKKRQRTTSYYRCNVKSLAIVFENGTIDTWIKWMDDAEEKNGASDAI